MKVKYTIAAFILFPIIAETARNKVVSSIFIVAWVVLIPVCACYIIDWYRASGRNSNMSELERYIVSIPIVLLGAISTIIGTAIFIWGFYVLFIEEHLRYTGLPTILGGFGGGTILIVCIYLVRFALTLKQKQG